MRATVRRGRIAPKLAGRESRLDLLLDLHRQLPGTSGSMRRRTEEAIRQLEVEVSGPASIPGREATRG
jgi:hypothetical protein